MAREFKWDAWDYDWEGESYIIAKDEDLSEKRREFKP